ncbi:MAG: Lrp/AsnC family transcriptional regulator [Actinomycetota bacterium]
MQPPDGEGRASVRYGAGVPPSPVELDRIDKQIVAILQADGRRSYVAIAKQVGVSEGTARSRVHRLTDSGLLQVVGIADPLRLGFGTMAMIGIRTAPGRTGDVCRALVAIPETSYVVTSTGRFDVFAEIVCRDLDSLGALLTQRIQTIDGVTSAESFVLLEIHKLAYGWGVGEVDLPPEV